VKKKSPFLLLEILIALLLVSLCLVPLIQAPIRSYRGEFRLLEEMERDRLADWTFSEIKEKLLKNELPWENFPTPTLTTGPFSLPDVTLQIPGLPSKTVQRKFSFKCGKKGEKVGPQGEIYRLVTLSILFYPPLPKAKEYSYKLFLQKL